MEARRTPSRVASCNAASGCFSGLDAARLSCRCTPCRFGCPQNLSRASRTIMRRSGSVADVSKGRALRQDAPSLSRRRRRPATQHERRRTQRPCQGLGGRDLEGGRHVRSDGDLRRAPAALLVSAADGAAPQDELTTAGPGLRNHGSRI